MTVQKYDGVAAVAALVGAGTEQRAASICSFSTAKYSSSTPRPAVAALSAALTVCLPST